MKTTVKTMLSVCLLSAVMSVLNPSPSLAGTPSFKDVTADFWGYQNIQWAVDNQLLDGYPDGTFGPNQYVKQSEFLEMLLRAFKPNDFVQASNTGISSASYINYALKKGWKIIAPSSLQGPSDDVYLTRGMAAQQIVNTAGKNYDIDDSIQYVLDNGLSEGKTGKSLEGFKKNDPMTRTEAVTFIQRLRYARNLKFSPAKEEKYLNHWNGVQLPRGSRNGGNSNSSLAYFKTNPSSRSNDGAPFYEYGAPFTVYLAINMVSAPSEPAPAKPVEITAQVTDADGRHVWEGRLPAPVDQPEENKGGQEIFFQWDQKEVHDDQVPAGEYVLKIKSNVDGLVRRDLQQRGMKFFILPPDFQTENRNEEIQLSVNTQMYQAPSTKANILGTLAPQYVRAVAKSGNWHLIVSNWVGNAWIYIDPLTWSITR